MEYLSTNKEVANYIIYKYREKYKKEISPIKLQKCLYFVFAEVSAKTSIKTEDNKVAYLFEGKFEAWPYGPVDKKIYSEFKNNKLMGISRLEITESIKEYIDDILEQLFCISDFRLVDISHMDSEWKTKIKVKNGTKLMSNEKILNDYMKYD